MKKTNKQWLIEFYDKGLISGSDWLYLFKNHRELNEVPLDPDDCIGVAFCWADTPQGSKYWSDIDDKIREYYEQQEKQLKEIEVKAPKGYVIDHVDNSDFTAKIHLKKEDRSSVESVHQLDLETLKFCRDIARGENVLKEIQSFIDTLECGDTYDVMQVSIDMLKKMTR